MDKKLNFILLALVIIISVMYIIMEQFINEIKDNNYNKFAQEYTKQLKTLIKEKQNTTKVIGLALSNSQVLKEALLKNDSALLDLKHYSEQLRKNSDFKNVWFQVLDKEGRSFKRSWTTKKGDSLLKARIDVRLMLKDPKTRSTISTGKFDMTFKTMVPIVNDGEFIGIFEVITHFNSISIKLAKLDLKGVFLVDKSYRQQITKPFSKLFAKDYYIANKSAMKEYLDYLDSIESLEEFLKFEKSYFIDDKNDYFIVKYLIKDKLDNDMGHMLLFKELSHIKITSITMIRTVFIFTTIILILFLFILNLYLRDKNKSKIINKNNKELSTLNKQNILKIKELEEQKEKTNKIFNAQPNITIITNGRNVRDANNSFLEFFDKYNSLEEFLEDHSCICDFFEKVEQGNYIYESTINGLTWIEYILESEVNYRVMIKKDDKEYHFIVIASKANHIEENGEHLIVVSFLDISDEVNLHNDLRKKDKILMEQAKLASMGEMIGNIAHQWRQPLSIISTSASLLEIKDEYNELDGEGIKKYTTSILKNTEYLSKTIDDFRDYFKPDKKQKEFDIKDIVDRTISLISSKFKSDEIKIINNIESNKLSGFENELIQVFMNILNNAKDALHTKDIDEKVVILDCECGDEYFIVSIKDNGGGIADEVKNRIFEPYFTTKHQSQGTGIGLYMVEEIISKHMKGSIEVSNEVFVYNKVTYTGAKFVITLPLPDKN